jgi:nucleoside-diphosphate-sugar epimerase
MIAVLTGGTGFVGSHLVTALRAAGARVRLLRRPGSAPAVVPPDVETHVVDLADARAVTRSPVWDGATHCFHLGAATRARSARAFEWHNVVPTRHVVAACADRGTVSPRLVFVSSLAAAGPAPAADRPRREDDAAAPIEAYGASKLAAERVVCAAGDRVPATIVRGAAVYGPRDRDFLEAFRQAQAPLAVYAAPADQVMSVVHVDDLVRALMLAAERTVAVGRTYFVAAAQPVTWRELYRAVADAAGVALRTVQLPAWSLRAAAAVSPLLASGDRPPLISPAKAALARPRWWTCDTTRARAELGWRDDVPFADGVRATYDWYCAAGWLPRRATRTVAA